MEVREKQKTWGDISRLVETMKSIARLNWASGDITRRGETYHEGKGTM